MLHIVGRLLCVSRVVLGAVDGRRVGVWEGVWRGTLSCCSKISHRHFSENRSLPKICIKIDIFHDDDDKSTNVSDKILKFKQSYDFKFLKKTIELLIMSKAIFFTL